MQQNSHRSGPLKQQNKIHKTGQHRSKGSVEAKLKGRVSVKTITKRNKNKELSGKDRRNQLAQLRAKKKADIIDRKRFFGGQEYPPILVAIVSLHQQDDRSALKLLEGLEKCSPDLQVTRNTQRDLLHLAFPRFKKRFEFFHLADNRALLDLLDITKVADSVIFLLSGHQEIELEEEKILAAVLSQGLATDPVFLLDDIDSLPSKRQNETKKLLLKSLNKRYPVEKIHTCRNDQEGVLLLRYLGEQKHKRSNLRDKRAHLLAEKFEFVGTEAVGTLKLTGYVRGQNLSVNQLIHMPGIGSFQLEKIESASDPHPLELNKRVGRDLEMKDDEERVIAVADPKLQESLDTENEMNAFDGEQYLSKEDEEMILETDRSAEKRLFKVPKGTSDYQAAWIVDKEEVDEEEDEDSDDDDDSDDDEEMEAPEDCEEDSQYEEENNEEYETLTVTSELNVDDKNYDEKHVNFAEEQEVLKKFREARNDAMFPDEVDTPIDQAARVRFQKYRGLKSFRTSPWDPKENLPADYARIFQFENFNRTKKKVMNGNDDDENVAQVGAHVTLYIKDVPQYQILDKLNDKRSPLVLFSQLPHENKMTVLNFVVKRHSVGHQDPIKSKERLIFHCGYRRFAACPIFSQHTNGNKHKYERYWRSEGIVVMTLYAPIFFPPASILVYQERVNGMHELVGTGSLLNPDPDRIITKRTILSGHPFRVRKRVTVVRFMFFNREDIVWFKPIELRTKCGRRGHIKEPLGTHGHMKCIFDKQVSQQDTVLLNLYKRVFPKWNYDPFVPCPPLDNELMEEETKDVLKLNRTKPKISVKIVDSMET
jgi:pre-rRNA-processing protein TSR1